MPQPPIDANTATLDYILQWLQNYQRLVSTTPAEATFQGPYGQGNWMNGSGVPDWAMPNAPGSNVPRYPSMPNISPTFNSPPPPSSTAPFGPSAAAPIPFSGNALPTGQPTPGSVNLGQYGTFPTGAPSNAPGATTPSSPVKPPMGQAMALPTGGRAPFGGFGQGPIASPGGNPFGAASPSALAAATGGTGGGPPQPGATTGTTPTTPPAATDPAARWKAIAAANGVDWNAFNNIYLPKYAGSGTNQVAPTDPRFPALFESAMSHAVSDGVFARIADKYQLGLNDVVWRDWANAIGNKSLLGAPYQAIHDALEASPLRGHEYAIREFIDTLYNTKVNMNPGAAPAAAPAVQNTPQPAGNVTPPAPAKEAAKPAPIPYGPTPNADQQAARNQPLPNPIPFGQSSAAGPNGTPYDWNGRGATP